MSEESDFKKYRPPITEVTVLKAAESWSGGDDILSLNGQSTAMDLAFILLLATDSRMLGPFLLNRVCARELCALLVAAGFGPQAV